MKESVAVHIGTLFNIVFRIRTCCLPLSSDRTSLFFFPLRVCSPASRFAHPGHLVPVVGRVELSQAEDYLVSSFSTGD